MNEQDRQTIKDAIEFINDIKEVEDFNQMSIQKLWASLYDTDPSGILARLRKMLEQP